jgi:hypothetical protein
MIVVFRTIGDALKSLSGSDNAGRHSSGIKEFCDKGMPYTHSKSRRDSPAGNIISA